MAALNYYLGLPRGSGENPEVVTAGTATAGTAVDVELRMQMILVPGRPASPARMSSNLRRCCLRS
jgi:hypothetical protein